MSEYGLTQIRSEVKDGYMNIVLDHGAAAEVLAEMFDMSDDPEAVRSAARTTAWDVMERVHFFTRLFGRDAPIHFTVVSPADFPNTILKKETPTK